MGAGGGGGLPGCGNSICKGAEVGKGGLYFRHKKGSVTLVQRFRREYCGDTRELAWGLVVLRLAGVWILDEEQTYFRHCECWLLLFFLLFSTTQGSSFPVQASFQKPSVGRCKAVVCSQLGLGPHSDLADTPGKPKSTSWWAGGWGDHLLVPIVCQPIVGSSPSALRTAGDNGGMRSTGSCFLA